MHVRDKIIVVFIKFTMSRAEFNFTISIDINSVQLFQIKIS